LDSTALAVRDLVHVPVKVNVENFEQPVTALSVAPAADRVEEVRNDNVGTNDGIRAPFRAEINDAL
jgi:hypothetical protein